MEYEPYLDMSRRDRDACIIFLEVGAPHTNALDTRWLHYATLYSLKVADSWDDIDFFQDIVSYLRQPCE